MQTASGAWLLKEAYIIDCFKEKRFLPEEKYAWKCTEGDDEDKNIIQAHNKWRQKLIQERIPPDLDSVGVFSQWRVLLLMSLKDIGTYTILLTVGKAKVYSSTDEFLHAMVVSIMNQFALRTKSN